MPWMRGQQFSPIEDFVSFQLPSTATYGQLVEEIARRLKWRVVNVPADWAKWPIDDRLRLDWAGMRNDDGTWSLTIHASARQVLELITALAKNLEFKLTGSTLRFRVPETEQPQELSFNSLAGQLWDNAPRGANGRISAAERLKVAARLDEAGFKPLDYLWGQERTDLDLLNRNRNTFSFVANHPKFRRAVTKRWDYARSQHLKRKAVS